MFLAAGIISEEKEVKEVLTPGFVFKSEGLRNSAMKWLQNSSNYSKLAKELYPILTNGYKSRVYISELTGGIKGKPTIGCNIVIRIYEENLL